MSYSIKEAYDMLLILSECRGTFITAERLWRKRYPNRTPHSRNVFSRLAKRIKIKDVVQPQHNKATQIRRLIRDERTTEILASTQKLLSIYTKTQIILICDVITQLNARSFSFSQVRFN